MRAARHSRCTAVVAELGIVDREATLLIEDNGTGLRPEEKNPGGMGLSSMRRRSQELGGRMQLTSNPGQGCRVSIHFPTRRNAFSKTSA